MYSQPSFCLFFPIPLPPLISPKQWFCQPVEKLVVSGRLNIIIANSKLWRWSWPRMSYSWRKLHGGLDNMRTEESWWGHGNCVQVTLNHSSLQRVAEVADCLSCGEKGKRYPVTAQGSLIPWPATGQHFGGQDTSGLKFGDSTSQLC